MRCTQAGKADGWLQWSKLTTTERWWAEARDSHRRASEEDITTAATELLTGANVVHVTADDAAAFRTWAESLPGWSDGPEYARHPFTFHDVD